MEPQLNDFYHSQLLENLPVATYICDASGYVLEYNKAAIELWGRQPEKGKDLCFGSPHAYHTDGSRIPSNESSMAIALKDGRNVDGKEMIIQRPDGTLSVVMPKSKPVFEGSGKKLAGGVGMLIDVTNQKSTEEKLAWAAAIAAAADSVITPPTNESIADWGLFPQGVLGYNARQMIEQSVPEMFPELGADFFSKPVTGKIPDNSETIDEAVERIVSERTAELKKINQELEQFAYSACHDLQEPLRKIMVFADRLQLFGKEVLNEELKGYVQKINQSTRKMSALVNDLLNYAQADNSARFFKRTDLNEITTSVMDDLELLISKQRAITFIDKLPIIEAVPTQMHQLFFNLVSNSLKFVAAGRVPVISISCRCLFNTEMMDLDLHPDKKYYQLEFKDNGMGFNPSYSNTIFTIFRSLNDREAYPGSGIGLALCKKIVEQHNGLIFADGKENAGAKFTIILPGTQDDE